MKKVINDSVNVPEGQGNRGLIKKDNELSQLSFFIIGYSNEL